MLPKELRVARTGGGRTVQEVGGTTLSGGLTIYYANYTEWGPKAASYLNTTTMRQYHVHVGVETHLRGNALSRARRDRNKYGYRSFVCPAEPTGRGGTHGGTWILVQRSLDSHASLPGSQVVGGVPQLIGDMWSAAVVRMQGFDLVLVSLYMDDGLGASGANIDRLNSLATFLLQLKVPYIVLGDWNMEPPELHLVRWPQYIRGTVVQPRGVAITCTTGKGRLLDYAVVSSSLAPYFSLEPDMDSPWAPHQGLVGNLSLKFKTSMLRKQVTPAPMIEAQGPDRPWSEFWEASASAVCEQVSFPVDSRSCCDRLTQQFARFSRAFELVLRSRATAGEDDRKLLGRGQDPRFKVVPVQPPNPPNGYTYDKSSTFWGVAVQDWGSTSGANTTPAATQCRRLSS